MNFTNILNFINNYIYIIPMLLLISLLILVHELGHFCVARLFKIKVSRFGFGLPIGPTLWEKKIGDTIYCIHAFLLGGYVAFPDDDPNVELPEEHPDRFANHPAWQRFWVVTAGVISNVIFAYLLIVFVALFSGSLPSGKYEVIVKEVMSDGVIAQQADIKEGDRILSVNGSPVDIPMIFSDTNSFSKKYDGYVSEDIINKQIDKIKELNPNLTIGEDTVISENTEIKLPARIPEEKISLAKDYYYRTQNEPNGIKLSDKEIKLRDSIKEDLEYKANGDITLRELAAATSDYTHPVNIEILRNGQKIMLNTVYPNEKGILGLQLASKAIKLPVNTPKKLFFSSNEYIYNNTVMLVDGLVKLVIGKVSPDNLHGVVAIVKLGGDTLKRSIWDGLLLTALISIDLAIINVLPIPALDGGHVLFIILEKILGRKPNEKIIERISTFFFILLVVLMIAIVFNDVVALLAHKF